MFSKKSARNTLVLAMALFIVMGPAYRQVLHKSGRHLPSWRMFSGTATGIVALRFEESTHGQERRRVPFSAIDSSPQEWGAGKRVRAPRIKTRGQVRKATRKLCKKLGRDTEVFVFARQATRRGWRELDAGKTNRCELGRYHSKKSLRTKTGAK